MTEQEQIEEMANIPHKCIKSSCEECIKNDRKCADYKQAEALYNAGYRKVGKDSVVLSREELSKEPYNDFCKGCPNVRVRSSGMTDCCADYSCEQFQKYARLIELYEQSRKETAKEILNELIDSSNKITFFDCRMALGLDKLAKQYGVKVKE